MQKRILVLGAGFLGAAITRALVDDGYAVSVLTRSTPSTLTTQQLHGASVLVADVGELAVLAGLIPGTDHVVYAVGGSSPAASDLDPANDAATVLAPLVRVLELLRLRPQTAITYLSSGGTVYGNADFIPTREDVAPQPISSYGILKLTAERYLGMYARNFGLTVQVLRIANVYGPGQPATRGQGVVSHLFRCAITGCPLPLFGSPASVRDYLHVDDVARVVADLLGLDEVPCPLNVGTGLGHTVKEVADIITGVTTLPIAIEPLNERMFDVTNNVLDCSALVGLTGFRATPLTAGLERTWSVLSQFQQVDTSRTALGRLQTVGS